MDRPRVVIVDGYRERGQSVEDALGDGYACLLAETTEDALRMIRESRPVGVVVDFPFPTDDGRCLSAVLADAPDTAGIALVAYSSWDFANTRAKAAALGCDAFVGRTEGPDAVADTVRALISEKAESAA